MLYKTQRISMSDIKDINLKNYELIPTDDGSYTVYSKLYGEACHSTSGAREETIKHYIQGCQLVSQSEKFSPINILEVGLGVGIGFQETLKALKNKKFHFVSLEIDEALVLFLKDNILELRDLKLVDETQRAKRYHLQNQQFTVDILVGDARVSLPWFVHRHELKFHAIYQDAFSPKRNATLWTYEWFALLQSASHSEVILSTYSASSSIRKALIKAKWRVYKGEKFGPKRSSTRARLTGVTDPDIIAHLERSPAITLTDANATEYNLGNNHAEK